MVWLTFSDGSSQLSPAYARTWHCGVVIDGKSPMWGRKRGELTGREIAEVAGGRSKCMQKDNGTGLHAEGACGTGGL